MSGFRNNPFDDDEYVVMSLTRHRPALPVARDERKRALIKLSAVLLGYMAVVLVVLEISARY
jgi:hypothetical protein